MTTPRLGAPELTSGQATPETTVNEQVRYLESGTGHFILEDRDLSAPPGSPVDGTTYLVAGTGTGAWAGHDGDIAYYLNTAWIFINVLEGFTFWVKDENKLLAATSASTFVEVLTSAGGTRPIAFFFTTAPSASEVLLLYTAVESITLADDFAGSAGDVGANPAGSFVLDVLKNGVSVGSVTISTGGAFTFATTGASVSLVSGDQLKVVAPASPDGSIADVSVTFKGTV